MKKKWFKIAYGFMSLFAVFANTSDAKAQGCIEDGQTPLPASNSSGPLNSGKDVCCGQLANGVCRRKAFYNFPSYAKVKVERDTNGASWLYLEFSWEDKACQPNFDEGQAVEFEINIRPRCFLQPKGGSDDNSSCDGLLLKENYNLPGGNSNCYVDVWNYDLPEGDELTQKLDQRCNGLSGLEKWCALNGLANGSFDDKSGNFAVGVRNASFFNKGKPGEKYSFKYPVEINNSLECQEKKTYQDQGGATCPNDQDNQIHNNWGTAWITMQTFKNTCSFPLIPCLDPLSKDHKCPELIGAWSEKQKLGCAGVNKHTDFWLGRLCVPTNDFTFIPGFGKNKTKTGCATEHGEHSLNMDTLGIECHDCDGDLLFDTDFQIKNDPKNNLIDCKKEDCPIEISGSNIDCNDSCSTVNVCPEGTSCGNKKEYMPYCSANCGGYGCENGLGEWLCQMKEEDPPTCKGECEPGKKQTKGCWQTYQDTSRTCLDNCTWGPWKDCPFKEYVPCTSGKTMQQDCAGTTDKEEWKCNEKQEWVVVKNCPQIIAINIPDDPIILGYIPVSSDCKSGEVQQCENCGMKTCKADGAWGPCESQGCNPGCECNSGDCCDGCHHKSPNTQCKTEAVYSCQGSDFGQDVLSAQKTTVCSGTSAFCDGTNKQNEWQVLEDCTSNQKCELQGQTAICVNQSCTPETIFKVTTQNSYVCKDNENGGKPRLCLEFNQLEGKEDTWQYRVCKEGNPYVAFMHRLGDQANSNQNLGEPVKTSGAQNCSAWTPFSMKYLETAEAEIGGYAATVWYPMTCDKPDCTYYTGTISATFTQSCQ